jgi:hypothetical protein
MFSVRYKYPSSTISQFCRNLERGGRTRRGTIPLKASGVAVITTPKDLKMTKTELELALAEATRDQ